MEDNIFPRYGRVAIVDDKIEEVKQIQSILAKKGVPYIFYDYQEMSKWYESDINKVDGIRLLFLDIRLEEGTSGEKNLLTVLASTVERIIQPENGPYMIILWTNEFQMVEKVKNYLLENLDDKETTKPSHIDAIDKKDFISKTSDCLMDKFIDYYKSQNMLAFLMEIENNVMTVPANVVKMIVYSFVKDASNEELKKLFLRFARTEMGNCDSSTNATKTVLRLLSDLIRDRYMAISSNNIIVDKLSKLWHVDFAEDKELSKGYAEQAAIINTVLNVNIHSERTDRVPGKVYRQTDEKIQVDKDTLKRSTFQKNKSYIKEGSFNLTDQENKIIETDVDQIVIDITPSCDYAQGKNHMLRTLYGYIVYIGKDSEVLSDIDYVKKIKAQVFDLYVYVSPIFKIKERFCVLLLNTKMMDLEKEEFFEGLEYLFRLNDDITNDIRKKTSEILSRIGINSVSIKN